MGFMNYSKVNQPVNGLWLFKQKLISYLADE